MNGNYQLVRGDDIVAMAFLIPDVGGTNFGNYWMLNRIVVPNPRLRGQGIGTEMLTVITDEANSEGVTLVLGVDPDDMSRFWGLVKWYHRHGFRPYKRTVNRANNLMVRKPDAQ